MPTNTLNTLNAQWGVWMGFREAREAKKENTLCVGLSLSVLLLSPSPIVLGNDEWKIR